MPYLNEAGLTYFWQKIKTALFGKQDTLTGNEGQVVGFDASGDATPVPGWSNQNLADNAVWTSGDSIVNRGGQVLYTNSYCIDRWYLMNGCSCAVSDSGIALHYPSQPSGPYIMGQDVNFFHSLRGETLTFSVLFESADAPTTACVQFHADCHSNVNSNVINGSGLASVTCVVPDDAERLFIAINNHTMQEAHVKPLAAKLELGDHQTLAHQNEDGEWEIVDPPDYDLQYLLCSQYSLSTGKWVGSQRSNPNLLDNWYFPDPINQRGKTEYTEDGYTVDRLKMVTNGVLSLKLESDSISASISGAVSSYPYFGYIFENPKQYAGKLMTFSALIKNPDGLGYILTAKNTNGAGGGFCSAMNAEGESQNDYTLITCTGTVPANSTILRLFLYIGQLGTITGTLYIKAMKAELGSQQTLAHQDADGNWVLNDPPPNKALELAKCQRYLQPICIRILNAYCSSNSDNKIILDAGVINLPVEMRATPTILNPNDIWYANTAAAAWFKPTQVTTSSPYSSKNSISFSITLPSDSISRTTYMIASGAAKGNPSPLWISSDP